MVLDSFEAFFYTLAFIVPGFILCTTRAAFVPERAEDTGLLFLRFLTYSCVHYAFWSWLIYLIFRTEFFTAHPYRTATVWFLIIFISPLALGMLGGALRNSGVIRILFRRIKLRPLDHMPSAWDYIFFRMREGAWILVRLKDGKKVAGKFGKESYAATSGERDLYIQEVYDLVTTNTPWQKIPRSPGIWIKGDEIKSIEFWISEPKNKGGEDVRRSKRRRWFGRK
ncbi:MAG TPA: DUF6338 family protein [Pyrinomonadaceae bacterium]|jgi:hypothetical protein